MLMNISKKLLLFFATTTAVTAHAATDLSDYLSGRKVDKRGRTILHKLAKKSDQDDLTLKIKIFDFAENKFPAEVESIAKEYQDFEFLYRVSPELAFMVAIKRWQRFVNQKDDAGETALNYAKEVQEKRAAAGLDSHPRTELFITLLEAFELQESQEDRTIFLDKDEDGGNEDLKEEIQK